MKQLIFELAPPEPPAFANFVAGGNREAVAALVALAAGRLRETGVVIWGAAGVGKTHLLRATVGAAADAGRTALYIDDPRNARPEAAAPGVLVAVDALDAADGAAQGAAVHALQRARSGGRPDRWARARGRRRSSRCATTCARGSATAWSTRSSRSPTPTRRRRSRATRGRAVSGSATTRSPICSRTDAGTWRRSSPRSRRSIATRWRRDARSPWPCCGEWLQRDIALGRRVS